MEKRRLGRTDTMVTSVCLGTMTWGEQNTESEAHEQLNYAINERGVNFIDTAEMYPVPGNRKTQGRTESYIGSWIAERGNRSDFVLATKVVGRSDMVWTRDGNVEKCRQTPEQMEEALHKSLKRLQTDYIDLYQLHWLDRAMPGSGFGFHSYDDYDPNDMVPLQMILETLAGFVEAGKIRHIGISNETSWGMMKYIALSEAMDLPRMVSIQNCYNLLSRRFDYQQAEIAMREDVGLLPYSPLAMGYLTGKYDESTPERSRKAEFPQFLGRYEGPGGLDAVAACNDAARELGITPTQFALKFVESRPFVTANIIGATTLEQLAENIDAHEIEWTDAMEEAATRIHAIYRSPVAS